MKVTLRSIDDNDMPFLYKLYASTREEELRLTGWSDEQKESFLQMQFNAQHEYYQRTYVGDEFLVILLKDTPVGRLYVGRWKDEIRIIDIALLPEYRRRGIGRRLMHDILSEARKNKQKVSLHVEYFNSALLFYRQLGFREMEFTGVYKRMEWCNVPSPR